MTHSNYDFLKFQQELASIDGNASKAAAPNPADKKALAAHRQAKAKEDFLALRDKYNLTLAEAVSFFPPEDGIAYLQDLISALEAKPPKTRKSKNP